MSRTPIAEVEEAAAKYPTKGNKNQYTCNICRRAIFTVDADHGVTPMSVRCQFGCNAFMTSAFYRPHQIGKTTHEWYRPESYDGLTIGEATHVESGGLLLRELPIFQTIRENLRGK